VVISVYRSSSRKVRLSSVEDSAGRRREEKRRIIVLLKKLGFSHDLSWCVRSVLVYAYVREFRLPI